MLRRQKIIFFLIVGCAVVIVSQRGFLRQVLIHMFQPPDSQVTATSTVQAQPPIATARAQTATSTVQAQPAIATAQAQAATSTVQTQAAIQEMQATTTALNYALVQFNRYSQQQQKIAQTFRLSEGKIISNLILRSSFGVGNNIKIVLYEFVDAKNLEAGPILASATFPAFDLAREQEFRVNFQQQISLEANTDYVFVVETIDQVTETGIAFATRDVESTGRMYMFTRLIGANGHILDNNHWWQPRHSHDILFRFE
jgi:hypothetical protein